MPLQNDLSRSIPSAAPNPPPLPPRPNQATSSFGFGGNNGMGSYGGYGGGMYGSGMYGSGMYGGGIGGGGYGGGYGGYGYGGGMNGGYGAMNRFGAQDAGYTTNSFVRQAEENSRQAFQSVESVVQAFGSVAMMLESTFFAVYNSFRAVIGVADQMSRVKAHFAQILSALAVIKTLRWLYRKLLVLLRLRKGGLPEDVWAQATTEGVQAVLAEQHLQGGKKSSWPIMLFFAVVLGGPWLIYKLLSSMYSSAQPNQWMDGTDDHFMAVGEHPFSGSGQEELSFRRGQKIIIAPKEMQPQVRGWLLACLDGKKPGLIPANYVKVLGKKRGTRHTPPVNQNVHTDSKHEQPVPAAQSVNLDSEFNSATLPQSTSSQNFDQAFPITPNTNSFALENQQSGVENKSAVDILDEAPGEKNVKLSCDPTDRP